MRFLSYYRWLLLLASLCANPMFASEGWNLWPLSVRTQADEFERPLQTQILGPIGSEKVFEDRRIVSIRPLYTHFQPEQNPHWHILYPLFNYYHYREGDHFWHSFNLIRGGRQGDLVHAEVFPFIFIQNTGQRDTSYYAFWPVGGSLKNRFGRDRIDFALWPLFVRTQRGQETRFSTPYPFVQTLTGPESRGFGLWPLFGHFRRDGHYQHTWALWPFIYHYRDRLDREVPYVRTGFLPFYHRETAAGLRSATFVWPLFGYTFEDSPRPQYSEARLLWPFWIQGRGEQRYVNRWLPVYANERSPGYRKRWFGWPLLKVEEEQYSNLTRHTSTLLYFIYRDRRFLAENYRGRETLLWPLFGYWNDGRGQRQFQTLDPFNIFFGNNEKVRENWSPLFAVYRYDHRHGSTRHSILWNLIAWESNPDDTGSFHLGPLFEVVNEGAEGHWQLLKGFLGMQRTSEGRRLRLLWNDFNQRKMK